MKSAYKFKLTLILSVVMFSFFSVSVLADLREDAKVIGISGGEYHTLILTQNNWLWACGDNGFFQLGIGNTTEPQYLPVRVHGGASNLICIPCLSR